jgi:hypothetical protein
VNVAETTQSPAADPVPKAAPAPDHETPGELATLTPGKTPLARSGGAWALVNLVLTILTIFISVFTRNAYDGKKTNENNEEPKETLKDMRQTDDEYARHRFNQRFPRTGRRRLDVRLVGIASSLAAIALFAMTENVRLPMAFTDGYTIWHLVIAAAQGAVAILSRKRNAREE